MTEYVVFVGDFKDYRYYMMQGYLDCLIDLGILSYPTTSAYLIKQDMDPILEGDKELKKVLAKMDLKNLPKRYNIIKATVVNKDKLEEIAPIFCKRYNSCGNISLGIKPSEIYLEIYEE
jgi:hypothetical protein